MLGIQLLVKLSEAFGPAISQGAGDAARNRLKQSEVMLVHLSNTQEGSIVTFV